MSSATGLENLAKDMGAQEFWIRRLVAIIIDWLACLVVLSLVGLEPFAFKLVSASVLAGFALFGYSAVAEYFTGQTLGKAVMGLRLVGIGTKVDFSRILIREVSKVFVATLALDVVAGVLLDKSGRKRYLEALSDTTLVVERK